MVNLLLTCLILLILSIPVAAIVSAVGHVIWKRHEAVCIGTAIAVLGSAVAGIIISGAESQQKAILYAVATFAGALALPISHVVGGFFARGDLFPGPAGLRRDPTLAGGKSDVGQGGTDSSTQLRP